MGSTRGRSGSPVADDAAETASDVDPDAALDGDPGTDLDATAHQDDSAAEAGGDKMPELSAPEGHAFVVVAPRRSLRVPVVVGSRYEGDQLVQVLGERLEPSGTIVAVREDEVDDLVALGFVDRVGVPRLAILVADAAITGPTVNGRPGGTFTVERS